MIESVSRDVVPASLVHALTKRAEEHPDSLAFRTLVSGGADQDERWTWATWRAASERLAGSLVASGIREDERVAILGGTTPLWPIADLAIQWAGAVSVGLYPTSAAAQVREILADAEACAVFVDSTEQYRKVLEVAADLPALVLIVRAAGVAPGARVRPDLADLAIGELPEGSAPEAPSNPESDAILIYTSGSTGTPKGARITHRTLVASAFSVRDTLGLVEGDRMLSFLPFCHAAERIFGLATRLVVGIEAGMVPDPRQVFEAAAEFRPTIFGGLPRFYEKIHEAEMAERGPGAPAPSPVVARLTGGAVRVATSGGAALPTEISGGLDRLGLTVLGAYGLTEHLCVAFNRPDDYRFDDVGTPMPGTEIRIADDGEILVRRCELTFAGYHDRPDDTREAFTEDGDWLRTGDLGSLDESARLTVTGRKKELIALSTGKKVAPIRIEAALVGQPFIEHAVLVGEGRKFIAALLTLRRNAVEMWAAERGIELDWPAAASHPDVVSEVERQVEVVNHDLSRTESVRKFAVLSSPFAVATDELTPTLKVRRDVILRRHADRVDALYGESSS